MPKQRHDADLHKGAIEQDTPEQKTNTSLEGQLPHGHESHPLADGQDTDFPEPGLSPEHSGQHAEGANPEGATQDQGPGHRQKQNQNQQKDDPLAA